MGISLVSRPPLMNIDGLPAIRLLLASRHTLTRTALVRLFADQSAFQVVGDVGSRLEALTLGAQHAPDVILLDPDPDTDLWLDAIGPLTTAAGPDCRVLLLTGLTGPDFHRQALRSGAHGILDLDHPPATLFHAIERVHDGEVWLERRLVAELITTVAGGSGGDRARIGSLTRREREVVRLVSEGLRNKQIAERLSVADVTVRHHLTSIFSKLGVSDRLSLVVFAFHHGLVQPREQWHKRA